jgi:hypothetical protein
MLLTLGKRLCILTSRMKTEWTPGNQKLKKTNCNYIYNNVLDEYRFVNRLIVLLSLFGVTFPLSGSIQKNVIIKKYINSNKHTQKAVYQARRESSDSGSNECCSEWQRGEDQPTAGKGHLIHYLPTIATAYYPPSQTGARGVPNR